MNEAQPKKGLAVTSLVLGILSYALCLNILTGIPAIITGHVARGRARRAPEEYGGAGMALAGLILGYVTVAMLPVIAVLAGLTLPALAKAKANAQSVMCINNLKQVGLAARIYANEHGEKFPNGFGQLTTQLGNASVLICPGDPQRPGVGGTPANPATRTSSYEWVLEPGRTESAPPDEVMARCPIHGNILMADGSVQRGQRQR